MARLDARKLDHATLEEIRIGAVQQVQAGESPEAVIRALGFSSRCIYSWLAMYRAGGWDALKAKRIPGAAAQARGAGSAMGVPHGDGQEPTTAGLPIRAVDARDDRQTDCQALWGTLEPGVCWPVARAAWPHVSEAAVAGSCPS